MKPLCRYQTALSEQAQARPEGEQDRECRPNLVDIKGLKITQAKHVFFSPFVDSVDFVDSAGGTF